MIHIARSDLESALRIAHQRALAEGFPLAAARFQATLTELEANPRSHTAIELIEP